MLDWRMESYDNARRKLSWKTQAAEGGGVLSHFGSHCFHNLEWLAGPITGLFGHLGRARDLAAQAETLVTLALEFESGATGSVSLCSAAPHGSGHRIEIYGEYGALVLVNDEVDPIIGFRLLFGTRGEPGLREVVHEQADQRDPGEDHRVPPVSRLVLRFIDAVIGGAAVAPSFADGVRSQELIEAARASASGCKWVRIA
jgi:predicted dehydrogenase